MDFTFRVTSAMSIRAFLVAAAVLGITAVSADDAVMRYQLNVPLLLPSADEPDRIFGFTGDPSDMSVMPGASASTTFSFDAGVASGTAYSLQPAGQVPTWLFLSGAVISAMPEAGAAIGSYGPFTVKAAAAGYEDQNSGEFTVAVTAPPLVFGTQPTAISVMSTETKSVPISVSGGFGTRTFTVMDAGTGTPAPAWITATASSVSVTAATTVAPGDYGPYEVKVADASYPDARSQPFTVKVTGPSAATMKPLTGEIQNYHITNYGGSAHGFPSGPSVAVRDALYDGLDNPIVTMDWSGLGLVGLRFGQFVDVNSCFIRITGPNLPNPMTMNVSISAAGGVPHTTPIAMTRTGNLATFAGNCNTSGLAATAIYLSSTSSAKITVLEFKAGYDGVYPQ